MTGPVENSRRSNVEVLQQQLERAAGGLFHEPPRVEGKSARGQGGNQPVERGSMLDGPAFGAAKRVLAHPTIELMKKAGGLLGVVGRVASPLHNVHLAIELFHAVTGSPTVSKQDEARIESSYGVALLKLAEGVLPRGYIEARSKQRDFIPGLPDQMLFEMNRRLGAQLRSPEKARLAMSALQQVARQATLEGMEWGVAYALKSDDDLEALLARDSAFRSRFESDVAFRNGVRSMMWLSQTDHAAWASHRQMSEQKEAGR